ncbi:putative disease resistance protein RGA1 isoform X5 [Quercus robur]|uniref:putative disease resistance protein RGA1 isoform X5 n=1 Tax=Quercus robur TaxID=38942 RepID=UPI0021633CDC|nr:putative disease resistance protein RGA1 isoform X5 [Quercus robur]
MADLLLSALVSTVVGNLSTSALKEFAVAWGLGTELDNLKSTMSAIRSVVKYAEEKQSNNEVIMDWLGKLKDVACDADNVLDEFATEALMRKLEREKGATSQVSRFFSLPNRLIFRMKMAHKLKNVRNRLDAISRERSFHLGEGDINTEAFDVEKRQTGSLVNESKIYGRDEEKEKIIEVLLTNVSDDQDNLAIYAIWGMGGLGKTTLAQLVYNDARVKSNFELRIWVCVSDDFQIRRLLRAIIESIDRGACSISELDPLQQKLQEKLRGRKFLLVLDDVWNENQEEWDRLKHTLMCGEKGSMLIETTRIEKIALMMARVLPIHHIGCLPEDESWSLFKGRAFGLERVEERSELESIGKEIVKKCGGVPLAINALGGLVCSKRTKSEWSIVKESQIWNLPKSENSILPALMLSYHYLSPHLRQCFAYCCVFPKDHELKMDKLIELWMANGFIPFKGPSELYDFGVDIFNELVQRSFFQDVKEEYPGHITCKMHDLMHDLAESIMRHECIAVESSKDVKVEGRIFHMFYDMISSRDISFNEDLHKVRSLRSCLGRFNRKASWPFFLKQKYLRVLDFKFVVQEVPRSINNLKHLRYLDMSGSNIKVLPKSTTCLLNLQTLKLDYCHSLCELPKGMKHMKSLMYLGITGCDSLIRMPEGMGQLTCLQSLSIFIAGKKNGYQVSELKGLNLRNNLTIKKLDNVRNSVEAKNANLIGKQNLHSLSLVWRTENKSHVPEHVEDVLDGLQPHSNLKKLSINNYHGSKIPTWIQDSVLRDLVEISLDCWERCEHLPLLGKLPLLKVLKITGWHAVKYIGNEFHGDGAISFPSLKEFTLHKMRDLEEWRTMNGRENFPCLSTLDITDCPKLVEIPIIPSITDLTMSRNNGMLIRSVMNLTSLSSLVIDDMDDELTVLPDGLLQNHKMLKKLKISKMPNLKSLTNQLDNLSALNEFRLRYCDKIESLPEGLQNLHSLRTLNIWKCNNLLSLPMNGLQGLSSLRSLYIGSCNKFCSLSEGIQYLIALEDLNINLCPKLISLPEGIQHLTALHCLQIGDSEDLSSLPKQIGCLTSLSYLGIGECPNLMSIPDELQNLTALETLTIDGCPHLEKRCKKDSGEDWHKISHIPDIVIYPSSRGWGSLRKLKCC